MPSAAFPPTSPSVQTSTVPSYLYLQYNDDDDLQGFITAYNGMTQSYVDWFVNAGLPVYTQLQGTLLDWIAGGVYGITRPTLGTPSTGGTGPINTTLINSQVINGYSAGTAGSYYLASDDVFQRIITWHTYKADGKVFTLTWLKRRVLRFLYGVNGTSDGIPNNQISFSVAPESGAVLSLVPPNGPTIDFATGNGTTTVFNAGNTYYPNNKIYKNDWQGNQLQYSTPRTNYCPNSEGNGFNSWGLGTGVTLTSIIAADPSGTSHAGTLVYTGSGTAGAYRAFIAAGMTAPAANQKFGVKIWMRTHSGTTPLQISMNAQASFVACALTTSWQSFELDSIYTMSSPTFQINGGVGDNSAFTIDIFAVEYEIGVSSVGDYIPTNGSPVTVTDYSSAETGIIADTSGVSITISTYNVTINVSAISNVSASILQAFHDAVASSALELPPQFAFSVTL